MAKVKTDPTENAELVLFSNPPELIRSVREGNAGTVPTRQLNLFYVAADTLEKAIKTLKEKCRPVIIDRRNQGTITGDKLQHREFRYSTPQGEVTLQVQERIIEKPDPAKLEGLLKTKGLLGMALTTTLDLDKVDGMLKAGLLTPEEMASVSAAPQLGYALIAKISKGE